MLPNNLIEVRKNHKFNLSSLNKWIDNHLENYENIIDIKQFVEVNQTQLCAFENKEKLILEKNHQENYCPQHMLLKNIKFKKH